MRPKSSSPKTPGEGHSSSNTEAVFHRGQGREEAASNTAFYHSCIGFDPMPVQAASQATILLGCDAIVAVYDPADVAGGPKRIGVALDKGDLIRLQLGELRMAPGAERAKIVPRGAGRRYRHYACGRGRFVNRTGWPANDLARGTERAEARLAELTIEFALAPEDVADASKRRS